MIGVMGTYSNTDSFIYGGFWSTYFDSDRQRLSGVIIDGEINNDYSDFQGSGLPVSTTDNLKVYALRYAHVVSGDWYAGIQGVITNYAISADNALSGEILEQIGLTVLIPMALV